MTLTDAIAQHIIDAHEGDNWTDVNIKNSLQDISLKEALTVTKASANTISALLHHITFYNEVVLERLHGSNPKINDANGFNIPILSDQEEWQQLKQRNLQSAHNLAEAVKKFPEEKLFLPIVPGLSIAYKTLHGVIEHAYYHLGQMVLLRNLIRKG